MTRLPAGNAGTAEIAGIADIAGREWMIACWDWKNWRGCRTGLPGLETCAQKGRHFRGCWECRTFSPRLPKVLAKIVEIATETAGRHWRDCRDCWECRECRYIQDCRDCRDCRPRWAGLPICPAENGWLHAEIEKIDAIAGRHCRDCRVWLPKMPRLPSLLGVKRTPNLQTEITKIATENVGRHCGGCRDCWGCPECRFWQNCRDRRDCRPRMQGFPILPAENGWLQAETKKKLTSLLDGIAGSAAIKCRERRGCWEC